MSRIKLHKLEDYYKKGLSMDPMSIIFAVMYCMGIISTFQMYMPGVGQRQGQRPAWDKLRDALTKGQILREAAFLVPQKNSVPKPPQGRASARVSHIKGLVRDRMFTPFDVSGQEQEMTGGATDIDSVGLLSPRADAAGLNSLSLDRVAESAAASEPRSPNSSLHPGSVAESDDLLLLTTYTYCSLPTTYCSLPTTYYLLPTTRGLSLSLTAYYCLLPTLTAHYLLLAAHYLLLTTCYLLLEVCR